VPGTLNPSGARLSTATIKNTWISPYGSLYSVAMWWSGIQTTWPLRVPTENNFRSFWGSIARHVRLSSKYNLKCSQWRHINIFDTQNQLHKLTEHL
jgi:hypothetical protein